MVSGPRRYGADDPEALTRLLQLLAEPAWHVDPSDRVVVAEQLERLRATIAAQSFDRTECRHLAAQADRVERAWRGRNPD